MTKILIGAGVLAILAVLLIAAVAPVAVWVFSPGSLSGHRVERRRDHETK